MMAHFRGIADTFTGASLPAALISAARAVARNYHQPPRDVSLEGRQANGREGWRRIIYTTPENVLLIALSGLGTGVLGALLGTGGGVFLIPIMVLAFDVPMHYAVATSIVSVIATSSAVASTNVERGTANMKLGMIFEVATALGAITGGLTAAFFSPGLLEKLFAAVLIPTGWLMWKGRTEAGEPSAAPGSAHNVDLSVMPEAQDGLNAAYFDDNSQTWVRYQVRRLGAGSGICFLAGNLSGLLGVGGGIFKVPALHLLCDVPIKAAAATSNFMIGVTAAASAFIYYGRGEVRPALTAAVVLGVVAGSALGTLLNRYIQPRQIRKLFAILLFLAAVQMLFRT